MRFVVKDAGVLKECFLSPWHSCAPGSCGEWFIICWQPNGAAAYAATVEANSDLHGQLEEANVLRTLKRLVICSGL